MNIRAGGILMHITSLPSPFGIGDIGPAAWRFVDWLAESNQRYWQILPLNPTSPEYDHSPYQSISAFAANPLLISPALLARDGLLDREDLQGFPGQSGTRVEFNPVVEFKSRLLSNACDRFREKGLSAGFRAFCARENGWLDDFTLFRVLKEAFGKTAWHQWPEPVRMHHPDALNEVRHTLADRIENEKILQYLFARQWQALRGWCRRKNVRIIGDLPIYVQHDSADVWAHPHLFKLDDHGNPVSVSGVPPDYFSETGQLWGSPIYRWDVMEQQGFDWWVDRIARNLELFEIIRIDHFRGLVAFWEVAAGETTAIHGEWRPAPVWAFLNRLRNRFPFMPFIAEDLGTITADVREVIGHFGLPGMRVLQFGMDGGLPGNPHAPHNYPRHCIAYTGTHDNNTSRGWFEKEADEEMKNRLMRYAGCRFSPERAHETMIRLVMGSVADTAIFPVQDILGLGEDARMNRPGLGNGNWRWRLNDTRGLNRVRKGLADWMWMYGRG